MRKLFPLTAAVAIMTFLTACSTVNNAESISQASSGYADGGSHTTQSEESVSQTVPVPQAGNENDSSSAADADSKGESAMKMTVRAGSRTFTATLAENDAAQALAEMLQNGPLSVSMHDYSGFEKVGALGVELPADDSRITAAPGDIMLYNGNQIVVFYGSNSWSYTRLGSIDSLTGWEDALGSGDITITFSLN